MHDTAYRIGGLAMQLYSDLANAAILEIGSQNVNGTLRDFALPTTRYTGLDIEAADGVDLVMQPGQPFPVDDEAFDLVMATSVFEHDPAFWITFVEMCRKAKHQGYIYVNAPSNGLFHQYPQDHWRFYPDCGLALVEWARTQGQEISLVETFVAEREGDVWNDFVGIFRKGPLGEDLPQRLVSGEVPCTNIRTWRSGEIEQRRDETEDMHLMKHMGDRAEQLEGEIHLMRQQTDESAAELERVADEREALARALKAIQQELTDTRHKLASLESTLIQRQEEIEQAWAEAARQKEAGEALQQALDESIARGEAAEQKLVETNAWVFRLSGERRAFETQTARLERKLEEARADHRVAEVALDNAKVQALEVRRVAQERLDNRNGEIATLTQMLKDKQAAVAEAYDALARSEAEMNGALAQSRTEKAAMETQLGDRFREIATLSSLLAEREALERRWREEADWLREAGSVLLNGSGTRKGRLLGLLPASFHYKRQQKLLKRKGLFDSEAYLAAHPDVAAEQADPLRHYLKHGIKENRRRD